MTLYRKPTERERQDFINYGTPEIVLQAMIPVETSVQEQGHREIAKRFTDTECDIDYDADWPYECEAKDKYRDSHRVAVCRSHSAWWHATKERNQGMTIRIGRWRLQFQIWQISKGSQETPSKEEQEA